jgi:hypothetical protein
MSSRHVVVGMVCGFTAWLLAGCAMPAQVRAPRTLEAGRVEHTIGLQRSQLAVELAGSNAEETYDRTEWGPLTPTYALRMGITDRLELGARASMGSAGVEGTMQLLESRYLDLALGVDVGWNPLPVVPPRYEQALKDETGIAASLPLLLGWNVSQDLTVIALGAPVYSADAVHLQASGGVELRYIPGIRLRPHVSYLAAAPFDRGRRRAILDVRSEPFILLGLDVAFGGDRGHGSSGIF